MKRLYLMILLVLNVNIFSLDHGLITGFSAQYNILNRLNLRSDDETFRFHNDNSITLTMITGYRVGVFRVVGTYSNLLNTIALDSYLPRQDFYTINVSFNITDELKLSVAHTCTHPVTPEQDDRSVLTDFAERYISLEFYKEF